VSERVDHGRKRQVCTQRLHHLQLTLERRLFKRHFLSPPVSITVTLDDLDTPVVREPLLQEAHTELDAQLRHGEPRLLGGMVQTQRS
jgi:hypothetical protein